MILEIDHDKRRISLGLKQTKANPWTEFANKYGIGDKVDGQIKIQQNILVTSPYVSLSTLVIGIIK